MKHNSNAKGSVTTGNRFVVKRTGRTPYTTASEFVQAIGQHLTPDIWDAIIVRAVRDAMFGKSADRTKARDFLSKHLLSERKENLFDKQKPMPDSMGALLTELFDLLRDSFHRTAMTDDEAYGAARDALALVLVRLSPAERHMLLESLVESETPEAQGWFKELEQKIDPSVRTSEDSGPVRIYLPANGT